MLFLVEVPIEPRTPADAAKLRAALVELTASDTDFGFHIDPESGQTVLAGQDEWHLDQKIDALRSAYKVEANIGAPQVAYRETLGRRAEIDYTHKKQTGGSGLFARIKLVFEPLEAGEGYSFESKIAGRKVPKKFIPGVKKGLESAKENGLLAGFPVIDFKATLIDGAYHDLDSSVLAFEIAARAAFLELRNEAEPILLEPIMKVEVVTPEDYLDEVVADLNLRRSLEIDIQARGDAQVISAFVPLASMFGYADTLHGMSQGRAQSAMRYDRYEPVSQSIVDPDPDNFPPAMAMRA